MAITAPNVKLLRMLVIAGVVTACHQDASQRANEPAVRDSAGILIVENTGPAWQEAEGWRVDPVPLLQVGKLEGEAGYLLSNVVGAVRLSDGSIAVAEAGSSEVRFFDGQGRFRHSVGRAGAGPDEFQVIAAMMAMPGDSLLVYDPANRRLSVVHPDAGIARSFAPPSQAMMLRPIGLLTGQAVIAWSIGLNMGGADFGRDTLDLVRIPLDGLEADVIGRFPGESREYVRGVGPEAVIATVPRGFWFGSGDAYEIGLYGSSGELQRLTRLPYTPVPVSAAMIAQWESRDAELRDRFGSPAGDRPVPERRAYPNHLPPYVAAVADSEGNVWIRPNVTGARALWNVIDPGGRYLGDVVLPDGFIPFQIGSDYILARAWDEYHVEYLRMYRLTKPQGQ